MDDADRARSTHRTSDVQRALAHPIRAAVFVELQRRAASPSELASVVDASVGVVSYHVRVLAEAGLVELVGTVPRRGALKHFYQATGLQPVGATLRVSSAAAETLRRELLAAIARAEQHPGDVPVAVVAHLGDQ